MLFRSGRENQELIQHFRRLGQLRKQNPALRLGSIRFLEAGDRHLVFQRCHDGQVLKIYCNRSADSWEIPAGRVLLGYHLQVVAPDWLTLGPRGFCIVEE